MAGARDYSLTAADNINVGGVSIAEGMARSSVNNAQREALADIAELLFDFGGETITTGSGGAYALTLPSAPAAYGNNLFFIARLNHDAGGAATININGLGAKALGKLVSGVAASLVAGDAPASHRAMCIFSTGDDAVLMLNPALTVSGPAGAWLADPTSANLAAAVTDEIGSPGQLMFSGVMDTDAALAANSDARVATQKATKSYVDAAVVGIHWAPSGPVYTATTANITLSGEQTIDGVLTAGSRVLVKDQTAPAENGIYLTNAGVWARATDTDTGSEMVNLGVFVADGATQVGSQWRCTSTTAPTLGTDPIAFALIGSTSVYSAGAGLQLVGTQFSIADDELLALGSTASAADMLPYYTGLAAASTTPFTATGRAVVGGADADAIRATLNVGAAQSPQFGEINLGHASDTTIQRSNPGQLSVEGNVIYSAGGTDVAVADGGTGASTAAGARINLGIGAGDSPSLTAIELGHPSDTTLTRPNPGKLAVEGNVVAMLATENAFTERQQITKTTPGARAIGLFLENRSTTPGTETTIDLAPNPSGVNIRTAQIAAVNVNANATMMVLRTGDGVEATDAVTIRENQALRLHAYGAGLLTTDSSGVVTATAYAAGDYTPSFINGANVDSTSLGQGFYIRIGSVVSVTGSVEIDTTADATLTTIHISLPVASNLASSTDLRGTIVNATDDVFFTVVGNSTNDHAQASFTSAGTSAKTYSFSFMYRVI